MAFQNQPGCGCCSQPTFSGTVAGCNNISTGIGVKTVTIKDGATVIWTGSTDANGHYTGNGTLPASVTVEVAASDRFAAFSGLKTVSGTVIAGVQLSPASGYHCLIACAIPLADTVVLTAGTSSAECPHTWDSDILTYSPTTPAGPAGWLGTVYEDGSPFITTGRYFMDTSAGLALVQDDGSQIKITSITTTNGGVICPPSFLLNSECATNSTFLKFVGTVTE